MATRAVEYGGEDPANKHWYDDGYYRETLITCKDCRSTSDLKRIAGEFVCTWHRYEVRARAWADREEVPDPSP